MDAETKIPDASAVILPSGVGVIGIGDRVMIEFPSTITSNLKGEGGRYTWVGPFTRAQLTKFALSLLDYSVHLLTVENASTKGPEDADE